MANPRENLQQRQSSIPAAASAAAPIVGRPKEDTIKQTITLSVCDAHACRHAEIHNLEDQAMMRDVESTANGCHY